MSLLATPTATGVPLPSGGARYFSTGSGATLYATIDTLAELGVEHVEVPTAPERVWLAIQCARARVAPMPAR